MKTRFRCLTRRQLILILFIGFIPFAGYSQETGSCAEKLLTAQNLFERGQVEQVARLLAGCIKSGFNREESLAAYKLIIQTYMFEDRLTEADSAMLDFLKRNPEYRLSPTDHSSFVHLYNNFRVRPVVQISVHLGTNQPYVLFVEPFTVPGILTEGKYTSQAVNIYASIEAKFRLSEKLELNIETGYSQLKYTNTEDFFTVKNSGELVQFGYTTYNETQTRIEVPLSATYNIRSFGKFTPYGRLGLGPALTLSSVAIAEFVPSDINGLPRTGPDIDRNDSRRALDLFVQAGAGIKFKTRSGYLFAEARSNFGIFNQTVREDLPSLTHSSEELRTYYSYVDDDFNLNAVNFSIGYTRIFYKPSKRSE